MKHLTINILYMILFSLGFLYGILDMFGGLLIAILIVLIIATIKDIHIRLK